MIARAEAGPSRVVVDTSALIAVLQHEPEAERIADLLLGTQRNLISSATRLELGMLVLGRREEAALEQLDRLTAQFDLVVEAVTAEQATIALDAFRRFGKGRHPAALNFGDCFVYALARSLDLPLLCKGDDFARTDLRLVEY